MPLLTDTLELNILSTSMASFTHYTNATGTCSGQRTSVPHAELTARLQRTHSRSRCCHTHADRSNLTINNRTIRPDVCQSAFNFFGKGQNQETKQQSQQQQAAPGTPQTPEKPKPEEDILKTVFAPKFKLPLAIALAGAAFEAYLQPVGAEGFQERGINKTEITFTDREFLADARQGVLHVELISASNLRVADFTGASDPYAILTVGGSQARSKVIGANLNPVWDQTFVLYVKDFDKDLLKVRLYDEDFLTSDDDLGTAVVPLRTLQLGTMQDLTLPLEGPGGQGEVKLRVLPLRFSDHILDALTSDVSLLPEQITGDQQQSDEAASEQLLAVASGEQVPPHNKLINILPGFDEMKAQVSKALDQLGLLDTKGGVSSEEVAANPWKVLARMAGSHNSNTWQPVAFVDNEETDTQVWLYRSKATKEAVIAFRGTEQVKWKDLATDLNLTPCSLNPERVDDGADTPLPMRLWRAAVPSNDMLVHQGFLTAYDSVKPQVFGLLDTITAAQGPLDVTPWKVYITGHSLGGALATLCAYELTTRRGPMRSRQALTLYSYGAPRVGNKVFANAYDKAVPDSWRVTNSRDIIPSVPRLLGYAHVKHSVRINEDGHLDIQEDAADDVFGEGRGGLDVVQELADKIKAQERTWEEVYEEIKAAELAILDRLISGAALEEHMEDFYLATLQQVVVATGNLSPAAQAVITRNVKGGQ